MKTVRKYQQENKIEARNISVFLGKEVAGTKFFCPFCRNPIMVHQQRIIAILPGMTVFSMPHSIKCSNKNCNTTYHFHSV
ncbi:MAG: hypothetical protein B6226_03480 [Candidatus Cloacimonetes bacterium 4572_65]|nr:MAG: hypothetical protein B6226_03480 [Candidatus Cloacimonetes bacterium 4572_65]